MKGKLFPYYALVLLLGAIGCKQAEKAVSLDLSNMDTSVDPAKDFYMFVNGTWERNTSIPDDESTWGSFNELRKENNQKVLSILEKAANSNTYAAGSDQMKAADFYTVGMDTLLAEKRGIDPIQSWVQKIENIENLGQLQNVLIKMHTLGFSGLFGAGVYADLKNSEINTLYLVPNGIGLPNRDYYFNTDSASMGIRDKYVKHIEKMLNLSHKEKGDFSEQAQLAYNIEEQLAESMLSPIQQRNLEIQYNKLSIEEIGQLAPSFDWTGYLKGLGVKHIDTMIVTQPQFIEKVQILVKEENLEGLKWYLKWHLINRASPYLNKAIVQADFDFYSTVLHGTTKNKARWERVLAKTNGSLGEALGKLYVDEVFPPEAKLEANEMVDNILFAFGERIKALDWMTEETKIAALKKLENFTVKIGYPDKWKDYSSLIVENSGDSYSYFGNVLHASRYSHEENIAKIGKPVDKQKWEMNVQTVNAYYNPINNEIVFPAAILQPPFYYYKADAAINFGGIGAVIGHEISHGFDDSGRKFDEKGNMNNWWTDVDESQFKERTQKLVAQFNKYEVLDSLFIQGELTLGENIGDLGGLNAAYDGLQRYYESHEKPGVIDGFTQEQRFFLSWGTIWRIKYRDESLRAQVMNGPHSPGMYRAFVPLSNLESFYAAFDVEEGENMWLPDSLRVKIW